MTYASLRTQSLWHSRRISFACVRSPFYKDTHREFRHRVRTFVEKEVTPFCNEWDEAKKIPRELFVKAYEARLRTRSCFPPGSRLTCTSRPHFVPCRPLFLRGLPLLRCNLLSWASSVPQQVLGALCSLDPAVSHACRKE